MQLPKNPLQRFQDVFAALNSERGWFADASPLRFASMTAVTCEGQPSRIASSIRKIADDLKRESGWFGELNGELRFVVAAMLLNNQDSATSFMAEVERVRAEFRSAGLRRGGVYEVMAILILRGTELQAIRRRQVERLKAIYDVMKRYHWWLTGTNDFPACAILVSQKDTPEAIGQGIEEIYQQLHAVGFRKGDPLQTAANLLYISGEKPSVIADRYYRLAEGFRSEKTRIWQTEYDELAILSFLSDPPEKVVAQVLEYQVAIRQLKPRPDRSLAFNLASGLAFVQLVKGHEKAKDISDAKAMLDLQAIIQAQQAAAVAAITASSAAATASSSS